MFLLFVIIVYYILATHVVVYASAHEACTYRNSVPRDQDNGTGLLDKCESEPAIYQLSNKLHQQHREQRHLEYYYKLSNLQPGAASYETTYMHKVNADRGSKRIVTLSSGTGTEQSSVSLPTATETPTPTAQIENSPGGNGDDDDNIYCVQFNALRRRRSAARRRRRRSRSLSNLKSSQRAAVAEEAARRVVRMPCLWGRNCRGVKENRAHFARGSRGLNGRCRAQY